MTAPMPHDPVVLTGRLMPLGADGTISGIAKRPVPGPWTISVLGIAGDAHGDMKHHGGPEKAIHHYPFDHYATWREEIGLHSLLTEPGAFGENLSTTGWTEANICIGDVVRFGPVLLQVSQGRQPCFRLNRRFDRGDMAIRVQRSGRTGWYYRVHETGVATDADALTLVDRPQPDWPLARLIRLLYVETRNRDALAAAASMPELANGWRELFQRRIESGTTEDWSRRLDEPRV